MNPLQRMESYLGLEGWCCQGVLHAERLGTSVLHKVVQGCYWKGGVQQRNMKRVRNNEEKQMSRKILFKLFRHRLKIPCPSSGYFMYI